MIFQAGLARATWAMRVPCSPVDGSRMKGMWSAVRPSGPRRDQGAERVGGDEAVEELGAGFGEVGWEVHGWVLCETGDVVELGP